MSLKKWFSGLSKNSKSVLISSVAVLAFGGYAFGVAPTNNGGQVEGVHTSNQNNNPTTPVIVAPKVEHKTLSVDEEVPFTSTTISDANIDLGKSEVRVQGRNGLVTHNYDVTYTDGVETSRVLLNDQNTRDVVQEVIAKGTRLPQPDCPNGVYLNSVGASVCRPYESDGAPAGATAKCVDGTYSFSQSRRGTCSHHGGVSIWL